MTSAWLTLQQHALDISTLAPAHSTPKGAQPLHTHHHPTGETNTHVIFGVDVGFGFEQCDGDIGTAMTSSLHQRRAIILRTHNDTERQPKCGHPSSDTHFIFVVDVGFGFDQCDGDIGLTKKSSPHQRRPIILRTHNDTERQSKCVGIPHLGGTTAQPSSTFGVPKLL